MKTNETTCQPKHKTLFDPDTCEYHDFVLTEEKVNRDTNFVKFFLKRFLETMSDISNMKTKTAFWIIDHLNSRNELNLSQRDIAEQSGYSLSTVQRTLQVLQANDFLRQMPKKNGYFINPNILFKGSHDYRMAIGHEYISCKYRVPTNEEKIKNLSKTINKLLQQREKLINAAERKEEEQEERQEQQAAQEESADPSNAYWQGQEE